MPAPRYCLHCGQIIPEPSAGKKYCCDACRRAARSAYQVQWARAHFTPEMRRAKLQRMRSTPEGEAKYKARQARIADLNRARFADMPHEDRKALNAKNYLTSKRKKAIASTPKRVNRALNLTGQRFGRLTALERTENRNGRCYIWRCLCDCGRVCYVDTHALTSGGVRSCGCLQDESRRVDITGERRGHLTALSATSHRRNGATIWAWRCDCGAVVFKPISGVGSGLSTMCPACARRLKSEQASAMAASVQRDSETNMIPAALESLRAGKLTRNNTSGVRGVSWHNGSRKWVARISDNGKTRTIGYFTSLDEAAQARAEAVLKKYGASSNEEDANK